MDLLADLQAFEDQLKRATEVDQMALRLVREAIAAISTRVAAPVTAFELDLLASLYTGSGRAEDAALLLRAARVLTRAPARRISSDRRPREFRR